MGFSVQCRRNAQTHRLDIMISVCPWSYTTQLEVCDDVSKVLLLPWACECAYMAESECECVWVWVLLCVLWRMCGPLLPSASRVIYGAQWAGST